MKLPQWFRQFRKGSSVTYFSPPIFLYKISGQSMEPTLHEGDIVIGVRSLFLKIKKGDVLIFKKNNKTMIKRVVSISRKSFRVEGDNTIYSIDSRHFGDVNKNEVIAKIVKTVHAHE